MGMTPLEAAKYVCEKSDWSFSNLQLQKVLYIAQMFYLGEKKERLLNGGFEAWYYGPVQPTVYHKCKIFGAELVEDIFDSSNDKNREDYDIDIDLLDKVVKSLKQKESWELEALTHSEKGAWNKNYRPGGGIPIPDEDMIEEYHARKPETYIKEPIGENNRQEEYHARKPEAYIKESIGENNRQEETYSQGKKALTIISLMKEYKRRKKRFYFILLCIILLSVIFFL